MNAPITGYAEGFYGHLLSWSDRRQIVDALHRLGFTTYYYAPKEDPCHRLQWRTPYSSSWCDEFREFCGYAHGVGIGVVAGVAPGLDFDFSDLPDGSDFARLVAKSEVLLEAGADVISLLMDDIDANFEKRCGCFQSEGAAHAALANALGDALSGKSLNTRHKDTTALSIWVTPRIYADELISEAEDYLTQFVRVLNGHHCVLYCGGDVVASTLDSDSSNALRTNSSGSGTEELKHRVIFWDNLYANDYCPRRLFVGPWQRRSSQLDVLLNPTGMVHTDCLLLALMATSIQQPCGPDFESLFADTQWQAVLRKHGVPDEFYVLAHFFYHPYFNDQDAAELVAVETCDVDKIKTAIEYCLWRWKTPLSREWYAFIFGLKHDLLTLLGEHPAERILKTQNQPLANVLLAGSK
ncbi:MAG: beta-N-acetylglucosaminidase domain-containing protein [Granulosicoccus sp.]